MSPSLSPAITNSSKVRIPSKLSHTITFHSSSSETSDSTPEPRPTSGPNDNPPKIPLPSLREDRGTQTVSPQDSCNGCGWIERKDVDTQKGADSAAEVQSRLDHIAAIFPCLELENPNSEPVAKNKTECDDLTEDVGSTAFKAVENWVEEVNAASPFIPSTPSRKTTNFLVSLNPKSGKAPSSKFIIVIMPLTSSGANKGKGKSMRTAVYR